MLFFRNVFIVIIMFCAIEYVFSEEAMSAKLLTQDIKVIENSHYRIGIDIVSANIIEIFNKDTSTSCLMKDATSSLFGVTVDEKPLKGDAFTIKGFNQSKDQGKNILCIQYEDVQEKLDAKLSIISDDTRELSFELALVNNDTSERSVRGVIPNFSHIKAGKDLRDTTYFFPREQGYFSDAQYDLVVAYGLMPASMQVVSLFNTKDGSGLYYWIKDPTGRIKTIRLRKIEKRGAPIPFINPYGEDEEVSIKSEFLSDNVGVSLLTQSYIYKIQPTQTIKLPAVIVGIGKIDWHQALGSYMSWVRTWWKAPTPTVPLAYRNAFSYAAAHDYAGGPGFEKGFLNEKTGKYAFHEKVDPTIHSKIQPFAWWFHDYTDHEGDVRKDKWYKWTVGDYFYENDFGGLPALKESIAKTQQKGVAVVLYMSCPSLLWYHGETAKKFPDLARMDKAGNVTKDWWFDAPSYKSRCIDACTQVEEWQDFLAQDAARVVRDTGCEGIFLDTANMAWFCYNPKHKHEEYPSVAAEKYLKKIRAAVKAVNPDCAIESENPCSDYLLQWTDVCWSKTFNESGTLDDDTRFDPYGISILRFCFPEVSWAEWAMTWDAGTRRCFFNGMGYGLHAPGYGLRDRSNDFNAADEWAWFRKAMIVFKENGDAFTSLKPEPLIPGLVDKVFVNKFPADGKTVFTIFNKSGRDVNEAVLQIDVATDEHVVDLFADMQAVTEESKTGTKVKLSIKDKEVACLAKLAKRINVEIVNNQIVVSVENYIPSIENLLLMDAAGNIEQLTVEKGKCILREINKNEKYILKLIRNGFLSDEIVFLGN